MIGNELFFPLSTLSPLFSGVQPTPGAPLIPSVSFLHPAAPDPLIDLSVILKDASIPPAALIHRCTLRGNIFWASVRETNKQTRNM